MKVLFDVLNSVYPLSEDLGAHLLEIVKMRELRKGQLLLKAGHVCDSVYFVTEGLLRSYYLDKNGKEINKWFMKQYDVVYAVRSFLQQIPSKEYIQALEPSVVCYISYRQLKDTYERYPDFNIHGRILTEKYYQLSEEREEIMRMPTAMERYKYLLEHFTDLVNQLPDKYLASYLRMSPVSLSRLRNQRSTHGVKI